MTTKDPSEAKPSGDDAAILSKVEEKKSDLMCGVEIDYKGVPIVSQNNMRFRSEGDSFGMGSIEMGGAGPKLLEDSIRQTSNGPP